MASDDGHSERAGSIASSHTETGGHDEFNEKTTYIRDDESLTALKSPASYQDTSFEDDAQEEDDELLSHPPEKPQPPASSATSGIVWIAVNTLATVGIVSFFVFVLFCKAETWIYVKVALRIQTYMLTTHNLLGLHKQGHLL